MKIDVLGSGSAFSLVRNTSAVLLTNRQQQRWLIDCGPTVPRALWQRGLDVNEVDVVYFTHIHPDHCAGLPALLNRWKSFARTKPLTIFCQPEHRNTLIELAKLATFPVQDICFDLLWRDTPNSGAWHDWHFATAATQHEMSNLAIRIEVDGQSLFYSGDGRPTLASIELMMGCDIAFQECAVSQPLLNDASHGDVQSCLALAKKLHLPALGLYHCYDEEITILEATVRPYSNVFISFDGLSISLDSDLSAYEQSQAARSAL